MSKIIVREYDNSTTNILSSNNFTVALAGFGGVPTADASELVNLWDENDCAEFTSQADFVSKVGLVGMNTKTVTRVDSSAIVVKNEESTGLARWYTSIINSTYTTPVSDNSSIYTLNTGVAQDSDTGIWCYKNTNDNTIEYFFTVAPISEAPKANEGYGILEIENTTTSYSYYKLSPVTDITELLEKSATETVPAQYTPKTGINIICVSDLTKLGNDGISFEHKGNQIAYELLGLGFPIIYKKIQPGCTAENFSSAAFWDCFRDRSLYNFRYIMTGWAADPSTNVAACNVLTAIVNFDNSISLENADTYGNNNGRGDCTALCDFSEDTIDKTSLGKLVETTGKAINAITGNKYTAILGPRVIYNMTDAEANLFEGGDSAKTFPASFHYLACLANALSTYNEWYAIAGYTRGIAARTVTATTIKYGDIANNTLAPRVLNSYVTKAANLVCYDHGNYILKGNRTAMSLNTSGLKYSHFLNIRQLCTTIKKRLQSICAQLAYDPNSDILWHNFVAAITPTLDTMKADQGISGYKITKVTTSTKGVLKAKIRIVPIEAVEDFEIDLSLEDSLDGITISTNETE